MSHVTAADGTRIFFKDWGPKEAPVVVFSHGWPLSSDAWDGQMLFLLQHGFRVVAHDRRGHGRSDQPGQGNDMDTYADDLAAVMEALDLRGAVMVGHSTGGGEVAHYIGRHGTGRVRKVVLVGAVPPIMASTAEWPGGLDISVFDGIRKGVADNRSDFFLQLAIPFFGMNREGVAVNEGLRQSFWSQGMMGSIVGQYACIREFSEVDYTADLRRIDVPTLVIHGDDDQIVPIGHAGALTAKIVPGATLKVYAGAPHGLAATHQDQLNADLLDFARG
ncbi:alpha/beta fold hydrolase [Roseomonas elaeocarpi]|uniref:Alpha/beta fold hydrolase n=1 Tax=Roseomonas elaeocarpi TaxID=907779 RepID=A0ABV6JXB2_9PROT